jgi:23S rRNA (pseudouridine1915-N3)-methyltransferase
MAAHIKIKLLVIGKTSGAWLIDAIEQYRSRIEKYIGFSYEIVPDIRNGSSLPLVKLMDLEAEAILKRVGERDVVVLLDEKGRQFSSDQFAVWVDKQLQTSDKTLVFIIGGAYGFGEKLRKRTNQDISLSMMTFSHQMVRLIFMEQLYRAFTIIKGEPYHHK